MKRLFLAPAVGMMMTTSASATLIVDFDPPINTVGARAADVETPGGHTWDFFASTNALLTGGTDGQNTTVYGGLTTTWENPEYSPNFRFLSNAGGSRFQLQVNPGTPSSAKGMLLWNKSDFLNGGNSGSVRFEAGGSLAINITTNVSASTRELRFVVNQGGNYYVTDTAKVSPDIESYAIDPSAVSWRPISTDGNYTIGEIVAITLDDIRTVGLYFDIVRENTTQIFFQFDDLTADATVIPGIETLVVDYDPPVGTGSVWSRDADSDTLNGDTWNFSDSSALVPSGGGQNDTIYGGLATTWSNGDYSPNLRHISNAGGSRFQLQVNPGIPSAAKGMLLWIKKDFLNGGDSAPVRFNTGASLSVNVTSSISASSRDIRFVVNQGGTYYVADTAKTTPDIELYAIDPSATTWRTISTDGNYTIGSTPELLTLDDIRAVGLFVGIIRDNTQQIFLQFDDFQAMQVFPPGGGGYADWATDNGIDGEPFGGDFDKDGIVNGVEYALGLNPTIPSPAAGALAGDTITFPKGDDAIANADVTWIIETSNTLEPGSWTTEATQSAGDATAAISHTFPPGTQKNFARLKVVQSP